MTACSPVAVQPTETPAIITRPVQIREKDRSLISTPGSRYTVTIEGGVTDSESGMVIRNSTILIVTETGSYDFWGGVFRISFPAEMVANFRAEAPGYKAESRQMRGHYQRTVTIDKKIRLERVSGGL